MKPLVMYDDDRLRQTLRLLAANGSQTILFTCQTGTEAVRGTGNRIPYDGVIVPFALCAKWGRTALRDTLRKGQGGIRWLQRKRRKNIGDLWIFVKVQFVLSLLVLGGLGYYVLGGYASR